MYENIVRSLGSVFDNRKLYGHLHKVAVQSLENAFEILSQALSTENELILAVTPEEFHINHQMVETKNALMQDFVDMLRGHEISTLTISKEISPDEFLRFVDLIVQAPETLASSDGIAGNLEDKNFPHIGSRKVTYVELSEDEVVVKEADIGCASDHDERDTEIMEYFGLSSDELSASVDAKVAASMQALIGDPAELGRLIVRSAGLSLNIEIPPGEPLSDGTIKDLMARIVEYLERTFELLKDDKSARSQTGKKKLSKSLEMLESDLGEFIRGSIESIGEEELNPICSSVGTMRDKLEIDALAAEYLRKRKRIEESEQHLLKYIEHHNQSDDDELRSKLIEGGLTAHSWNMLMIASGKSKSIGAEWIRNAELPEFKQLQDKLVQLSKIFCNVDPSHATTPEQLQKVIRQVEDHLAKLIKNTERRIKVILNRIIADENIPESRETESSKKLTRRQLLELIAEIVQELYQPLSVVQCVLDSILSQQVAVQSPEQIDFLELASRSTQRLNALISELYTVAGNPTSFSPSNV